MDHEPVKRRKISEATDLPAKDTGERPTNSTTQPKDDIHPSNRSDEGLTDDEDLENNTKPQKPTAKKNSRAVTPTREIERVRQVKPKVPREILSAAKKLSTQKIDKGFAMNDAAVDDPPADGSSTDSSSIDDATTGTPARRSGVRHASTLPATPTTPLSRNNRNTPSSAKSGHVVFSDIDDDPEEAARQFPDPHNIKLEFIGRALEVCNAEGIRKKNMKYDFSVHVRFELCQYMVRNDYIHGLKGAHRSTLDAFYDQYNLRDPQKLARARTFFIGEIDQCAKDFTEQIRQDSGTRNTKITTPSGNVEVIKYGRGYEYLLKLTQADWDETMKRKFFELGEAQDTVRTSVEDVLQLRDTFSRAVGLRPRVGDTPTSVSTPTPQPRSTSDSPGSKSPTRMAEIRDFINDGSAAQVYHRGEFSKLQSYASEQLGRLRQG